MRRIQSKKNNGCGTSCNLIHITTMGFYPIVVMPNDEILISHDPFGALQFNFYNSNQRTHAVSLGSQ